MTAMNPGQDAQYGVVRLARFNFTEAFAAIVLGTLVILVLLPLVYLVANSFSPDQELQSSSWFANYASTFGFDRYHLAIRNSIILAIFAPLLGLIVAIPFAWILARTDVPYGSFLFVLVFGAFVSPGFVNALAWLLLLAPKTGYINELWASVWGDQAVLLDIYSLPGLVFASFAAVYPVAIIFLYNAFRMIDLDMEESARVLGSRPLHALRTITIPLVRPAIMASLIVMMLESLVLFAAPAIIGLPAQIPTITTQLWYLFEAYPPGLGRAAALSLPLMIVTALLLWLQRVLANPVSNARASRAGKGRIALGVWRWPVFAGMSGFLIMTFILPIGVMVVTSLSDQLLRGISLSNLTIRHYLELLSDRDTANAILNSLLAASVAAFACVLLGGLSAYISERRITRTASLLTFLSMAPLAVPSMVYAVGIFVVFAPPPLGLYGTLTILVLAYTSKSIPFAFMAAKSAISSVPIALEDSARIMGASQMRALRDITVPLARGGALAGWLLVFVLSLKELPSSILLYTVNTPVIGTKIMDLYSIPRWEKMAALSIVLVILSSIVVAISKRFVGDGASKA